MPSTRAAIPFLFALAAMLVTNGCEPVPIPLDSINVENGPAFLMRGKGKLATFQVSAPLNGSRVASPVWFDTSGIAWQIECTHGIFTGADIEGLRLLYGNIPRECHQTVPLPPQRAPLLSSGKIYSFWVWSDLVGGLGGDFYVRKNGAVLPVDIDNCATKDRGKWVRLNCKTQVRFTEPKDTEAFADTHQRKCAFAPSEPGTSDLCRE